MTNKDYKIILNLAKDIVDGYSLKGKKDFTEEDLIRIVDSACNIFPNTPQEIKDAVFNKIEEECTTKHSPAACVVGDYDTPNWYSELENPNTHYWDLYRRYLVKNTNIDQISINLLDDITLPNILNQVSQPVQGLNVKRWKRGLIIGDVQSGKTATYTGLICKAVDAGYKVVILLAGITETLRQQTQDRIDDGIIGFSCPDKLTHKQTGVGQFDEYKHTTTSTTTHFSDFTGNVNNVSLSLDSTNVVFFVVKKRVSVLKKVLKWLKDNNLKNGADYINHSMILIDDEADNASINTKKSDYDPTQTNKLIRQICNTFINSTYIGITATPFANIFIDPHSVDAMKNADLFPENFIYSLPTPDKYISAKKIFSKEGDYHHCLRYITDIEEPDVYSEEYQNKLKNDIESLNNGPFYHLHKKEWDGTYPDSLTEAIYCFFLSNVIRDLRGDYESHRSMLVNMSRFVDVQQRIAEHVKQIYNIFIRTVEKNFEKGNSLANKKLPLYKTLQKLWLKHFSKVTDVTFEQIINKESLYNAIEKISVVVVNGKKDSDKLDYTQKGKYLRVIAVGGLALSRGLTLEGLMTSYFYRNTSTFDVLMQMGRWFGYRPGYADICQIWISPISASWYNEIAEATDELKESIKMMFDNFQTPKDFGLRVRDTSDSLRITAANKMRSATARIEEYTYYGRIYDTPYISKRPELNKINKDLVQKLVDNLLSQGFELLNPRGGDKDGHRYFTDVPKEYITDFLSKIRCLPANIHFDIQNILDFIKTSDMDQWDILFDNGQSDKKYPLKSLESVCLLNREVFVLEDRNTLQISSRRRALGTQEGHITLTDKQKAEAENVCKQNWRNEEVPENIINQRNFANKIYFENLSNRRPILVIMCIAAKFIDQGNEEIVRPIEEGFNGEPLIAFGIGFPNVKTNVEPKKYQYNRIAIDILNSAANELEEEEDYE